MVYKEEGRRGDGRSGRRKRLNLMYTNIDGILSSRLELRDYLQEEKPDIVCLAETKLNEETKMDFANNYNIWKRDRRGKTGGGVMVMTKKELVIDQVLYGEGKAEMISVKMKFKGRDLMIIVIYVPPKTGSWTRQEYDTLIEDVIQNLSTILKKSKRVILVGDFNCKEINWENYESVVGEHAWGGRFLNLMMENMMEQKVKENTRYRGDDEPARLDLVLTRDVGIEDEIQYKCPLGKSDHVVLQMRLQEEEESKDELYKSNRLNYKKTDKRSLREYFGRIDWNDLFEAGEVQEKYDIFMNVYTTGVRKFVPKYKGKEEQKNDWFNVTCLKAREKRDRAWRRWKRNRNERNRENYQILRNEYVKVRKEEERKFEKDIVEKCKEQPKLFYRFINRKLKVKETIVRLKGEEGIIEDPKDMADLLNNRFQQVFTKESPFKPPRLNKVGPIMDEIIIHKQEVYNLMEKLEEEKAMGPDEVSGNILKMCKEELIDPIYDIINCSLESGKVPREWKRAEIVPIYKSGRKEEPLNYRPVSLTSVICKICERIIKKHWTDFLEEHKIIGDSQFGFRKQRSCVTNLLSFYSRVVDVIQEREGWMDCIYLDLKKAFDKVPHERLLWKLEHKGGLKGRTLRWMESYLRGREMRTIVKDLKSEWRAVESGVPQGSVLAPILFLIYINDMPEGVNSYMNLFADDAKLCRRVRTEEDCKVLQEDLDRIWRWSKKWEMEFNVSKSHVMEMGKSERRPEGTYSMGDGVVLRKVNREKDLGVIMQDDGQHESHIDRIFGETYNLIRNIGLAFHYMDKDMMKKLITTLIRPRLEYAGVVWSPHKKKHTSKIERLQRMATKLVPDLMEMTYEERLRAMDLPTLEQRRERGDLIQVYKLLKGMDVVDNKKLILREEGDIRTLRSHSKKLMKGRCMKDVKKHSFPQRCVETWNGLSEDVVSAPSVHSFKEKLDKYRYGDRATRA